MKTEYLEQLEEIRTKTDRYDADGLQRCFDGLPDPEEVRSVALMSLLGPIFDKLRSIVEEMRVIEGALNRIGEWDDDEEGQDNG